MAATSATVATLTRRTHERLILEEIEIMARKQSYMLRGKMTPAERQSLNVLAARRRLSIEELTGILLAQGLRRFGLPEQAAPKKPLPEGKKT